MSDHLPVYFILTAVFFLVFFEMAALLEQYKERIHMHAKKIPWHTIIKIFCLWAAIIFLRKLTYYFQLNGIIQTKDTLFRVDEKAGHMIISFIFLMTGAIGMIKAIVVLYKTPDKWHSTIYISIVLLSTFFICSSWVMLHRMSASWEILFLIIVIPLLPLKMLCSGKYLGLLTALLTALYIVNKHKKLKTGKTKINAKFFVVPVLIIIVVLLWNHYKTRGDWKEEFAGRIRAAKSTRILEDLVDAAATIRNETDKSVVLRDIAAAVATTGDIKWASSIAGNIPDDGIRSLALIEIREIRRK